MAKTISLKLSFVVAFALFAILAAQFVFTSAFAQTLEKPTATAPGQDAPTPAQDAQLRAVAESSFEITLQFTAAILKPVLGLKVGETAQISVPIKKPIITEVALIAERFKDGFYIYFQDGITIDAKKPMKVAGALGGLKLAAVLDALRSAPAVLLPFDPAYPGSLGFEKVKRTFAVVLSIFFDPKFIDSVLTQSGAELIAQANAAACPKNIQKLAQNIATRYEKNKNAGYYIAGRAALKANLMRSKNFQKCDLESVLPAVPPTTAVAPGRPRPGTPGAGIPVPPTPPPGGTPSVLLDFGDARLGFPVTRTENGPRHVLSNRVWLGELIDGEADGLRTDRDDTTGVDDEDGMVQSNPQFILRVKTGRTVAATVYVNAWEDWNANGRWDINANGAPGDEWIVRNQPVQVRPNTAQNVSLIQPRNGPNGQPLPAAWSDPAFWVRFTVTETRIANGNPALGQKPSGETEDYIGVAPPAPSQGGGVPPPAPTAPAAGSKGAAGAAAGH